MSNYVVTNIRFPEEDYLRLKEEAAKKRMSLSAVVREKIGRKKATAGYVKKLLSIKSDWFSPKDVEKNRSEIEERIKQYSS